MAPQTYRRKNRQRTVQAIQVTQKNGSEVEAWCGGESYDVGMAPGLTHHVDVPVAGTFRRARAIVGHYVIKSNDCFYILSAEGFAAWYESIEEAGVV